jgi:transposase InsO family protein
VKFEAIEAQRRGFPVGMLCRVLGVSRSGYYEWRARHEERAAAAKEEQRLVRAIEAIHLGSKKNYGSPPIGDMMRGLGFDVSDSTVARRMRKHGMRSRLKRKFKVTTDSSHKLPVAPNHLMQDFRAYRPDQIWMSDITYVSTREGWLYVCAVIDLFSRKIVGWSASHRLTTDLVISAFLRAHRGRRPKSHLIFHSDRGCQYASFGFVALLSKHGVIQSMSRSGNCWDSAPIESFWARLKTECVYWENFATRQQALRTLSRWIERDYNTRRAHSANGYQTPDEAEQAFVLAAASSNR